MACLVADGRLLLRLVEYFRSPKLFASIPLIPLFVTLLPPDYSRFASLKLPTHSPDYVDCFRWSGFYSNTSQFLAEIQSDSGTDGSARSGNKKNSARAASIESKDGE